MTRPAAGDAGPSGSDSEDEFAAGELTPLWHHALATTVYVALAIVLWRSNQDGEPGPALELTDEERRILHYQSNPEAWVKTRLPTTAWGWFSLTLAAWMVSNWVRRVRRVRAIVAARARARARALNRAVLARARADAAAKRGNAAPDAAAAAAAAALPGSGAGDDVASPCSDPTCLRCRPSAHAPALARNAARLRALTRAGDEKEKAAGGDPDPDAFASARIKPEVLALASAVASDPSRRVPRHRPGDLQAPTVFRLGRSALGRAAPIHRRDGVGCDTGSRRRSGDGGRGGGWWRSPLTMMTRGGRHSSRCYCAPIWREIAKLEAAAPAIKAELERSAMALRSPRKDGDSFAPFDPAVRKGGEWSAVYLWRNGVRDRHNCEAFPAAEAAVEAIEGACFRGAEDGCAFGSAYLSRLTPGTVISPHCGPCDARLRCSVGVRVPTRRDEREKMNIRARQPVHPTSSARGSSGEGSSDGGEKEGENPNGVQKKTKTGGAFFRAAAWAFFSTPFRVAAWLVRLAFGTLRALDGASVACVAFLFRALFGAVRLVARSVLASIARLFRVLAFVCTGAGVGAARGSPCALTVGDERAEWREAEAILFDDSFVHGAEYVGAAAMSDADAGAFDPEETISARVVLVVDFWHPALSANDRRAIRTLYPPGMGEAKAHENVPRKTFEDSVRE